MKKIVVCMGVCVSVSVSLSLPWVILRGVVSTQTLLRHLCSSTASTSMHHSMHRTCTLTKHIFLILQTLTIGATPVAFYPTNNENIQLEAPVSIYGV